MRTINILGILLGCLLASNQANAVPITFAFTGTTQTVGSDINDGTFSQGQSVSGQFTFESTTPDTNVDASRGSYVNAISAVSYTFGTYSGTAGPGNIETRDNVVLSFGTFDEYIARGIPAAGDSVNGRLLETFNLQLLDDTLTMLSSDDLPLTAPSPFRNDNGNTTFLILQFNPVSSSNIVAAQVRATVNSIRMVTSVPEPGTLGLLGLGLFGLALARLKQTA